jgi:hypothetical protein
MANIFNIYNKQPHQIIVIHGFWPFWHMSNWQYWRWCCSLWWAHLDSWTDHFYCNDRLKVMTNMMVQCSSRLVNSLLIREALVSILFPETDHPGRVFLPSFTLVKESLGYNNIAGGGKFHQIVFKISHLQTCTIRCRGILISVIGKA